MHQHIAHIRKENDVEIEQAVSAHCRSVSQLASEYLTVLNLKNVGLLTGLLHDMGKCTKAFDTYIRKSAAGEPVTRGSVNHTFAGVIYLFEHFYQDTDPCTKLTCELIAYAVGAHHGLFDCLDEDGKYGFTHRRNKDKAEIFYDEAKENFLRECAGHEEIEQCFYNAVVEIKTFLGDLDTDSLEGKYTINLLSRMILSALVDADRSDTAAFDADKEVPKLPENIIDIWKRQLFSLEAHLKRKANTDPINQARAKISDLCSAFAENESGLYRLNVPTGGGKTLASLRYALSHAIEHPKRRIFYIIPLLSIIEQNVDAIQKSIADPDIILEHHSNVVTEKEIPEEASRQELLAENWLSPIVITTLVQFLNTLFLGKMSSVRRFHALCDSVIIIDEIQTLPVCMISIFNMAINFLVKYCRVTVLLCSATQPTYENVNHPIALSDNMDVVPYDSALWQPFARTKIVDKCRKEKYSVEDLADFATELMKERESLLIICNTKAVALNLYKQLEVQSGNYQLFHLSTSMCAEHRRDMLEMIKACLDTHKRVVCVSTQLVEAGVDFSFNCVVRCLAGMDSIAQAAGRCNRHGEFHRICEVYIVNVRDENLSHLQDIQRTQNATRDLLFGYAQKPEYFANDLLSREAIACYYKMLFGNSDIKAEFDYPLSERNTKLLTLLSTNHNWKALLPKDKPYPYHMIQAFKTAGDAFRVFDDNKTDVIVPYRGGAKVILELLSEEAQHNLTFLKEKLKEAKSYTVSIFEHQKHALEQVGGIVEYPCSGFICLQPGFYSEETGLDLSGGCNSLCYQ